VPPWFVVSSHAFDDSLTPDQRRALDEAPDAASPARPGAPGEIAPATRRAASRARRVARVKMAPAIIAAIEEAVRRLAPNAEPIAVRSSASDEDGAEHSFAGQLESVLYLTPARARDH